MANNVDKTTAGRTNYDKWDRVTRDLVEITEQEEEEEKEREKAALGLDGKYPLSQAEAEERKKLKDVTKAKKKLEKLKQHQESFVQSFSGLLEGHPVEGDSPNIVRLTRDPIDAFKRVIALTDTTGRNENDAIVLTQDLSLLESQMPANALRPAKSFPEDAENDVPEQKDDRPTKVHGLIKVIIENVSNCSILVKCKIITGTIELHRCHDLTIKVDNHATVTTVQADLSDKINLIFLDPVTEPKIFHAGVSNMHVQMHRDGVLDTEIKADYIADGAVAVGAASPEEYRFVTNIVDGVWVTEKVARSDAKAVTERELKLEKERRERAAKVAIGMAEDMIQIKDKEGNVLVTKKESESKEEEEVIEEVLSESLKHVLEDCEKDKLRGNEAFGTGEYAQAILQYSIALDKATQLGDSNANNKLFPLDILYSNRCACFLKLGQHEKAEDDARRALQINPDNLKANFRLGLALHASARYEEALPHLVQAQKKEPNNKQIQQALKFCEVRLEQERRKRMSGI